MRRPLAPFAPRARDGLATLNPRDRSVGDGKYAPIQYHGLPLKTLGARNDFLRPRHADPYPTSGMYCVVLQQASPGSTAESE